MCGIAGFWKPGHPTVDRDALAKMLEVLHHRGPDGQGVHVAPERGLAMGHARLSIIDLEHGQQPLHHPRRPWTLTVNGELYDYKRIRARLVSEGARFRTKSDSEIALHLFEKHGLDFLTHLRGEFAFTLFDAERERLYVVRDRFGIKPIYYRATDEAFYWGSEVKALLVHPDTPRSLSAPAVLNQMMQVMVPGTTAFEGIEAVRPGELLIIERRDGRLCVDRRRYWDLDFPAAEEHAHADDEATAVTTVRDRLLDAVALRLEADVPVGCYLSGGIDSCSILGLATPMQQSPVTAYTISFDHARYDEAAIATEMAEATQARQVLLELTADDLYGPHFGRVVWHAERTFYNTLSIAKWHMSRRVHDNGMKVVITGEGSDELFGGYPFFKKDMLQHGLGEGAELSERNALFKGAILAEETRQHPAWNDLIGFTPAWIQPWMIVHETVRPLLSPALREALAGYDPVAAVAEQIDPAGVRGRHPLDRVQYSWAKTMLEGQILTWGGDRVDMANSMESRPAFLDHHLAEYAVRIPPDLRIRDGVEKHVLREAMRFILPKTLYEREKFAFMAPPSSTDDAKARRVAHLAEGWLGREYLEATGLFDAERVAGFMAGDWDRADHARGARRDIIMNHLLGMQMLAWMCEHPAHAPGLAPTT